MLEILYFGSFRHRQESLDSGIIPGRTDLEASKFPYYTLFFEKRACNVKGILLAYRKRPSMSVSYM